MGRRFAYIPVRPLIVGVVLAVVVVSGPRLMYFPVYDLIVGQGYGFKVGLAASTATLVAGLVLAFGLKEDVTIELGTYLLWPLGLLGTWYVLQFVAGVAADHELLLAVGDLSKISVLLLVFGLIATMSAAETRASLRYFALFGLAGVSVEFVLHLTSGAPEFRLWSVVLIPAFLFSEDVLPTKWQRNGALIALVSMVILGGMRTQWVALAVVLGFYAALHVLVSGNRGFELGYVGATVLVPILLLFAFPQLAVHILRDFMNLFSGGQSVTARIVEYRAVFDYMASHLATDPLSLLFGFGLGAEYPVTDRLATVRGLTQARHHFIHSGFVAILFRTGLIGLALFCVALFRATKLSYATWSPPTATLWSMLLVFVTVSLVSPFMKALPYVLLTGYVFAGIHNHFRDEWTPDRAGNIDTS